MSQRYNINDNMETQLNELLSQLKSVSSPEIKLKKKEKFGISCETSWGVYQKDISNIVKTAGKNTNLGIALFDTGLYDARLLCASICRPQDISEELMEQWLKHFSTWEICDSFCMKLFKYNVLAAEKAFEWCTRDAEYEKRAGFVLMATYGFAHKNEENSIFEQFLSIIETHAYDDRTYVKKAVNWALRQIGKRNIDLKRQAIHTAERIRLQDSSSAKWIANDALRELKKEDLNNLSSI